METVKEKQKRSYEVLKDDFGYKNVLEAPRLEKVIINVGIGSARDKTYQSELVLDRLAKITGQKPAVRGAKKSIASFKVRQGDPVGVAVTLRGKRMRGFLDKLINVALPRTKDFRGVSRSGIDKLGNFTLGIREHTVFPETSDEELKDIFGMSITLVTTARSRAEAEKFLELLGMPFQKEA